MLSEQSVRQFGFAVLCGTAILVWTAIGPGVGIASAASCATIGSEYNQAQAKLASLDKQADAVEKQFQQSYQKAQQLKQQIGSAGCNRIGSDSNVCAPLESKYAAEKRKYQGLQNQHNSLVSQLSKANVQVAQLKPQVQQCIQRASAPQPDPETDCRPASAFAPLPPGCAELLARQRQSQQTVNNVINLIGTFAADEALKRIMGGNQQAAPGNGGCPPGYHPRKDGQPGCHKN